MSEKEECPLLCVLLFLLKSSDYIPPFISPFLQMSALTLNHRSQYENNCVAMKMKHSVFLDFVWHAGISELTPI